MPPGRATAPGRVPLHLARLAGRGLAPDREVGGVALAFHCLDAPLAFLGVGAREAAIIGHGRDVEIEPAFQLVAVLVRDALGEFDHLRDVIGRDCPLRRLADVQCAHIGPIGLLVMLGDVPDRLRALGRHLLHLVLARVGIVGQVAHIGDVDDVGELQPLPRERAPQHIGKHVSTHVADMRVVVDRRPAGVDARLAGVDGLEHLDLAGERIEQLERRIGHGRGLCPNPLPMRKPPHSKPMNFTC